MKKYLLTFIFIVTLLVPTIIFAQPPTDQPSSVRSENANRETVNQPENDADRNVVREIVRERVETKKATMAAKLTARKQANVQSQWQKLDTRLSAIIARLETLIERIESRVAMIANSGENIDTTGVETSLMEAKSLLGQTEADLLAANSLLEEVLASDDPKLAFSVVAEAIKEIRINIVEIHKILVLTIGDIRGLRVGIN